MQSKWNLILVPNLVAFISQKEKKRLIFRLSFVNLQHAKNGTHMFDAKDRYMFVVQIARLVSHLINHFSLWIFTV